MFYQPSRKKINNPTRQLLNRVRFEFANGKRWTEIKTDEPQALYQRLKNMSLLDGYRWRFQIVDNSLFVRQPQKG